MGIFCCLFLTLWNLIVVWVHCQSPYEALWIQRYSNCYVCSCSYCFWGVGINCLVPLSQENPQLSIYYSSYSHFFNGYHGHYLHRPLLWSTSSSRLPVGWTGRFQHYSYPAHQLWLRMRAQLPSRLGPGDRHPEWRSNDPHIHHDSDHHIGDQFRHKEAITGSHDRLHSFDGYWFSTLLLGKDRFAAT